MDMGFNSIGFSTTNLCIHGLVVLERERVDEECWKVLWLVKYLSFDHFLTH